MSWLQLACSPHYLSCALPRSEILQLVLGAAFFIQRQMLSSTMRAHGRTGLTLT